MRKAGLVIAGFLVCLCSGAVAHAAVGTFQSGSDLYTLKTGLAGGGCYVTQLGSGGIDVDCHDNVGNRAYGNTLRGCLVITGSGQCFSGMPPPTINATTETKCGTTKWLVGTGNNSGTCTTTNDTGGTTTGSSCDDSQGNQASVDCTKNGGQGQCGTVTGSGTCTIRPN
jgi:hypothetical protein